MRKCVSERTCPLTVSTGGFSFTEEHKISEMKLRKKKNHNNDLINLQTNNIFADGKIYGVFILEVFSENHYIVTTLYYNNGVHQGSLTWWPPRTT